MSQLSRRHLLASAGSAGLVVATGCLGDATRDTDDTAVESGPSTPDRNDTVDSTRVEGESGVPVADRQLPEEYPLEQLNDAARSGGPPPDGIPSIDSPVFNEADEPPRALVDESPVFGVDINGDARAYPQIILVWHEIVNDVVGGESVAVTYCPLTGTAQGFYRGDVEFGVSGQLINTNLVMFDRETESWWPQILAWGIRGPHEGDYLDEFQVIWTTWQRWRERHRDTQVLTTDTGFARDYGNDPYGSYVPEGGYYFSEATLFPPLRTDDRFGMKDVVIGARNADGALCVPKERLREQPVIEGSLGEAEYVTVYDPTLDTGFIYRNPEGLAVGRADDRYEVDGSIYDADALPLDRQIGFDAMWLAWFGYYPSTVVHG